jgi:ABC-type uncharacterized transport system auxiliary subunit
MKRTVPNSLVAILVGVLLIVLTGCSSPPTHYYALKVGKVAASPGKPIIDGSVAVERINGGRIYDQERIVFRGANNEIGYYEYHQWTSSPSELATQAINTSLMSDNYFRSAAAYKDTPDPDYILSGRITNFEEVDKPEGVFAIVGIELSLINTKQHASVWSAHGESELPVEVRNVPTVAQRLDEAMSNSIKQVMQNLGDFLKNHPGGN